MPKQGDSAVRRAQLIAPFGVGAMNVTKDGVSVICAGLDDWFPRSESSKTNVDVEEFKIQEWRLQRYLGVDHFRLPPDYRSPISFAGQGQLNVGLKIPGWRFPLWHWCSSCHRLEKAGRAQRGEMLCPKCQEGDKKRRRVEMVQVRFIAICEHGHIQDFPWREWVHRDSNPTCQGELYLENTGGLGLGAALVKCSCGKNRSLTGMNKLTDSLDLHCRGHQPWHGEGEPIGCGKPLRGTLRNATNVYYADVRSAIYLPQGGAKTPDELVEKLKNPPLSAAFTVLGDAIAVGWLRNNKRYGHLLSDYTDEQIDTAIEIVMGQLSPATPEQPNMSDKNIEEHLRQGEYQVLREAQESEVLRIKQASPNSYYNVFPVSAYFSRVSLISKMRETRVLAGFSRVFAENDLSLEARKHLLWRNMPEGYDSWLPANIVNGEGIYLELNQQRLREWESGALVRRHAQTLARRYEKVQKERRLRERAIGPRLMLIHTLAHLLINQLTFECGYPTASLRERLYVAEEDSEMPMGGLLIYTAAGDSEGTLGGLVRMGTPGNLERVLRNAIEGARWCSADPICLELGRRGQGPDSCNGAACHNCSLIPETSCELFNRFLDRSMLIGDQEGGMAGFFSSLAL